MVCLGLDKPHGPWYTLNMMDDTENFELVPVECMDAFALDELLVENFVESMMPKDPDNFLLMPVEETR